MPPSLSPRELQCDGATLARALADARDDARARLEMHPHAGVMSTTAWEQLWARTAQAPSRSLCVVVTCGETALVYHDGVYGGRYATDDPQLQEGIRECWLPLARPEPALPSLG